MDNLDFSEEEIQEQLVILGYRNIPQHRLREFKRDLNELIQQEKAKILNSSSELNLSSRSPLGPDHTTSTPPAYFKETCPHYLPSQSGDGPFLQARTADHNREVLTSWRLNREPDHQDSYARFTVAPTTLGPSHNPHRLHVLPDPLGPGSPDPSSGRLPHPTSQASSPEGGGKGKPFITRKVLRKHNGQAFVCDESVHSEDTEPAGGSGSGSHSLSRAAMYKLCAGTDLESSGADSPHPRSSFWSDGEDEPEVVERADRAGGESSTNAPLNPAVTSDLPPPAGQREGWGQRGDASHGGREEEDGDDDEGGSDDEDRYGYDEGGGGEEDDVGGYVGDEDDEGGLDSSLSDGVDDDDGGKTLTGENRGSPAPSHLTSGYGTYRPDSAGKDTEAGTIAEFDGETLAGDEFDEEDLHRFYCPSPSPSPPPPLAPRSHDPGEASAPGIDAEEGGGAEGRKRPAPDRKSSAHQRRGDEQRRGSELEERRAEGRGLLARQTEDEEEEDQSPEEVEEEPAVFCSNTDIRFIDSHLEPGCAGATWDGLRPGAPDVSGLEERLGGLRVATASAHRHDDEETENEDVSGASDGLTEASDGRSSSGLSLTAFESFVRDVVRMRTESALKPRPKSFIRPALGHPHTRNLKKMDPVTRYFQYKQEWDMFKVPGERDRRALHWEIKEQLAYQPPPARPRRTFVPNSYVVPTEKKRSALRWEVRNDLARGLPPPKHNYRF